MIVTTMCFVRIHLIHSFFGKAKQLNNCLVCPYVCVYGMQLLFGNTQCKPMCLVFQMEVLSVHTCLVKLFGTNLWLGLCRGGGQLLSIKWVVRPIGYVKLQDFPRVSWLVLLVPSLQNWTVIVFGWQTIFSTIVQSTCCLEYYLLITILEISRSPWDLLSHSFWQLRL